MAEQAAAADDLPARPAPPLPIAISQCLLGREVRYDGSDARWSFPHAALGEVFTYRGICPEVGIGMGVPRQPIQLVGDPSSPRVVGVVDPSLDVTAALTDFGQRTAAGLDGVAGYVFMARSPSCGLFRVKVHPGEDNRINGGPLPAGRGVHAAAVTRALPELPVEENGRLHDPERRASFVTRTFAYAHWQAVRHDGLTPARLIAFHGRYKHLLMAHSVPHYQRARQLLADLRGDLERSGADYVALLMDGLTRPATRRGHAEVLSRLQWYFRRHLDPVALRQLDELIHAYRRGERPLQSPVALLDHHLRRFPDEHLAHQVYLDPHPGYAGLRDMP